MVDGGHPFSPEIDRESRKVAHDADDLMPAALRRIRLLVTKQETQRIGFLQVHLDEAAIDDDVGGAEVGRGEGAARKHGHAVGVEEIHADPRRARKHRVRDADVRNVFRQGAHAHAVLEADRLDRRRPRKAGGKRHADHARLRLEFRQQCSLLCGQAIALDLRRVGTLAHGSGDHRFGGEARYQPAHRGSRARR